MPAPKGNKNAKGNKGGRKTSFKQEYCDQAYHLTLLGAIDKELAAFFHVSERTINYWKKTHEKFADAIKRGKDMADANVADRLYQRALGFEHDAVEIKVANGEVVEVPVRKVYPPDVMAATFWLKNRQPAKWRDKQDVNVEGDGVSPTVIILPSNNR